MKFHHFRNEYAHAGSHLAAHRKRGSMILEIIVALSIFSIICLPILIFIFSEEEFHRKSDKAHASRHEAMKGQELTRLAPVTANEYSNRHSCDSALARYVAASEHQPLAVSYPDFFRHERNVITAIRSVRHGGDSYLIVGTNSASTTDPDIYAYATADPRSVGSSSAGYRLIRSMHTGPGIVDFDIEGGDLYAIERSVVSSLWRIGLDELVSTVENPEIEVQRIPLLLQEVLPTRILATKERIFLGLDKNAGTELRILTRTPYSGGEEAAGSGEAFVLSDGKEIDAGVNDIAVVPGEILIASPNDIEVFGFAADSVSPEPSRSINLPGSSGNGKALAAYKDDVYIGRTVGNVEFHKLHVSSEGMSTLATVDVNRSILQIEEIFGGTYAAALAKTPDPALLIYFKNAGGGYSLKESVALPGAATAMTCSATDFIVATESIDMPIVLIRF